MDIDENISALKKLVDRLKCTGRDIPTVIKNCDRILSNIKMLEINISDLVDL